MINDTSCFMVSLRFIIGWLLTDTVFTIIIYLISIMIVLNTLVHNKWAADRNHKI